MISPFTSRYSSALVAWFAQLDERMRSASSGGESAVLPILRMLKSGERVKEGDAWEVVFRAGAREDGLPARSVRLALTWDGFIVGETAGREERVSTVDWKNVECGIRRTFGWPSVPVARTMANAKRLWSILLRLL